MLFSFNIFMMHILHFQEFNQSKDFQKKMNKKRFSKNIHSSKSDLCVHPSNVT